MSGSRKQIETEICLWEVWGGGGCSQDPHLGSGEQQEMTSWEVVTTKVSGITPRDALGLGWALGGVLSLDKQPWPWSPKEGVWPWELAVDNAKRTCCEPPEANTHSFGGNEHLCPEEGAVVVRWHPYRLPQLPRVTVGLEH